MATIFVYKIKKLGSSQIIKGEIDAENISEANRRLRQEDFVVVSLKEKGSLSFSFSFKKVSLKDRLIFTRQLAVMVKAGLPIVRSLEALKKQSENKYFKEIITEMVNSIKGGQSFSKTLARYPKIFSEVYVAVVKAGEETGQLSTVLFNLADQQEKEADLIGKIKSAMIYPAVILATLVGVAFVIVFFVLPSLKNIFTESGQDLPFLTRMMLGTSDLLRGYWFIFFPAIIGTILGLKFWTKTKTGRQVYDIVRLKLPIFGLMTKKLYMARFARTTAMLVQASLPILQSLRIVQKTITNTQYDESFVRISRAVESGRTLSEAIEKEKLFPPMVSQLVNLGEQSGNLEMTLSEVANFYDKEVDATSRNLSALLEPILLLVMGAGVAFVVVAVLGPIYGLVQNFGG